MPALDLKQQAGAVRMRVRVKPRASKSRVVGVRDGALEVAVAAPPVDGEANAELVAFLAKTLGLAKSKVAVVSGDSSRIKVVSVDGVAPEALRAAFGGEGD